MKILKLLFVIELVMLLQGCKYDPNCGPSNNPDIYYHVPDSFKNQIPYSSRDTLVFISDQGDTAFLIGQGEKSNYVLLNERSGSVDCPNETNYYYQNIDLSYNNINTKLFNISFTAYMNSLDKKPTVTSINLLINNTSFGLSSFEYQKSLSIPDDSIKINGIYHYGYNYGNNLLFNIKEGVLKIKNLNNLTWTKIK